MKRSFYLFNPGIMERKDNTLKFTPITLDENKEEVKLQPRYIPIEDVAEQLKAGEKIQLVGFGTFEVAERAARTGKNPQTGKAIQIPASKAPKFKAGKALKDVVNTPAKKSKKK